jgi:hypothetical protein
MKNLNNNLCKDIINSDFFIVTKNKRKNVLKLVPLLKEIKQFIRILSFLKNLEASIVFFNLDKNKAAFLIKQELSKIKNPIFTVYSKKNSLSSKGKLNTIKIFLDFMILKNKNLVQKFLNEKTNLVVRISHLVKENLFYNIRNTMDTFKKHIFLLSLIQKLFK